MVWVFHWINESVLVQGYIVLKIFSWSVHILQSQLVFVSWLTYIINCDEDERNAQIKPSVCILYITKLLSFFPERKGLFLYSTHLMRGVYFFTLQRYSRFYFCHCVLSVFVLLLLYSWMMEDSSNRPISHWTHLSMNLSIFRPVNLQTCQSILGGRGNTYHQSNCEICERLT